MLSTAQPSGRLTPVTELLVGNRAKGVKETFLMLIKMDSEVLYLPPSWRLLKQFGSLSQPPWVFFKGPVSDCAPD